jgi:hypothetical protein
MPRKKLDDYGESVALAVRDADEMHRLRRAAARVAQAAIDRAASEGALLIHVIHILQDHVTRTSQLPDTEEQPEQHEPEEEAA